MIAKEYRVDGWAYFRLGFEKLRDGTISIRALSYPSNRHSTSPRTTHVFSDGTLCVARGSEPRSMERALAIAQLWMFGYAEFCETGVFPNDGGSVRV